MSGPTGLRDRARGAFRWCFAHRETGAITIAQSPNAALWLFALGSAVQWAWAPEGATGVVLRAGTRLALAWWAADELLRGVNPWRRLLGAVALASLAVALARG